MMLPSFLQTVPDNTLVYLAMAWLVVGLFFQFAKPKQAASKRWPVWLMIASLTAALTLRSLQAGYWALTNMYESVLSLTLGLGLVWLWDVSRNQRFTLPILREQPVPQEASLLPSVNTLQPLYTGGLVLMLVSLGFGLSLPQQIVPIMPALASIWRTIHVPIVIVSYALFALSAVASGLTLWKATGLPAGSTSQHPTLQLPLDVAERCIRLGFALLAIGIFLGALWANESWGTYWNWDPKETMALATLLGYGLYLHLLYTPNANNPKLLSWVSLMAFAVLLLTYFGVNLLGVGLHSYGKF
jgi:cytochrome c-type biogenesis protein CcsB